MTGRRTLDAVELRGATLMRADQARVGDTVCFLCPQYDYAIEEVDTTAIGTIRHQHGNGSASSCYQAGEFIYIKRP